MCFRIEVLFVCCHESPVKQSFLMDGQLMNLMVGQMPTLGYASVSVNWQRILASDCGMGCCRYDYLIS